MTDGDGRQSRGYQSVLAFVDWNSQLRINDPRSALMPTELAELTLRKLTSRIARYLAGSDSEKNFRVSLRLYHGWYKGFEPSPNRRAIMKTLAATDFTSLSPKPKVVFSEQVKFGDCLVSAMANRLHERLGIHLPNTLRDRGDGILEEKMVDTAIASDVIVTAFHDPTNWILVAAEDDDLVPPIFAAESIVHRSGSRVLLMSERKRSKVFLKLDGISLGD